MTYKIGTRLKLLDDPKHPQNNGTTARVVGYTDYNGCDITIRVDNPIVNKYGKAYAEGSTHSSHSMYWTPIIPDGNMPSEFSFSEIMEDLKLQMMA